MINKLNVMSGPNPNANPAGSFQNAGPGPQDLNAVNAGNASIPPPPPNPLVTDNANASGRSNNPIANPNPRYMSAQQVQQLFTSILSMLNGAQKMPPMPTSNSENGVAAASLPNLYIKIDKLKDFDGYEDWRDLMVDYLHSNQLWFYISGEIKAPEPDAMPAQLKAYELADKWLVAQTDGDSLYDCLMEWHHKLGHCGWD